MIKKLLIILVVILILIVAIVFTPIAAVMPWFTTRSDQSITNVDTPSPAQIAISTMPAQRVSIGKPADPDPFRTPVIEQLAPSPICFTPADIFPFAFTPDGTSILVRGSRGVQVFNLDAQKEVGFLQAPKNKLSLKRAICRLSTSLYYSIRTGSLAWQRGS
jgi:hypothetical protein